LAVSRRSGPSCGRGQIAKREIGERRGEPEFGWDVDAEFVVAAAEVLHRQGATTRGELMKAIVQERFGHMLRGDPRIARLMEEWG
jgi:hypothetical protein